MSSHKPGTKKNPSDLFLAWDQITAIKFKRIGNAQQYYVLGKDGSEASAIFLVVLNCGYVAQCLNRIKRGGMYCRNHAADQSNQRQNSGRNQHRDG